MRHLLCAALLGATFLPSAALADHSFILPSTTLLSGDGNSVTFDAAASEHVFFFDHRPLQLETIKIFKPDGTPAEPYNPLRGRFRSVFDLKLDQQGTWKIASQQTGVTGSFKLDGEERRVGMRRGPPPGGTPAPSGPSDGDRRGGPGENGGPRRQPPVPLEEMPANATDVHLTEVVNTVETFVTDGQPTTTVFKPTGKGLEFDPITHPNSLAAGETARFRFLVDGKPAPNVTVTVVPGGDRYRDDTGTMNLTTGADGVVAVKWPGAGMYWLGAEADDKNPSEKRAEARKMTYAATFEVMTP